MIWLAVPMTMFGALGALCFKKATMRVHTIIELLKCPFLYLGVFLYGAGAILNIVFLRHVDYSIAYPMTSITYIWTIMLSGYVLKERITKRKIVEILFILSGVCLLGL